MSSAQGPGSTAARTWRASCSNPRPVHDAAERLDGGSSVARRGGAIGTLRGKKSGDGCLDRPAYRDLGFIATLPLPDSQAESRPRVVERPRRVASASQDSVRVSRCHVLRGFDTKLFPAGRTLSSRRTLSSIPTAPGSTRSR